MERRAIAVRPSSQGSEHPTGFLTGVVAVGRGCLVQASPSERRHDYGVGRQFRRPVGPMGRRAIASAPVQVKDPSDPTGSLTDVVAVARRGITTVLRLRSTEGYAWGLNSSGQLGDGTTIDHSRPLRFGPTRVVGVTAGYLHSLALRATARLWRGETIPTQLAMGRRLIA